MTDNVNHPSHYTSHPSGIECIKVTEHMSFCVGNAIKYLWRAGLKGPAIQDLEKARWYVDREIQRQKSLAGPSPAATVDNTPAACDALDQDDPTDIPSLFPKPQAPPMGM